MFCSDCQILRDLGRHWVGVGLIVGTVNFEEILVSLEIGKLFILMMNLVQDYGGRVVWRMK